MSIGLSPVGITAVGLAPEISSGTASYSYTASGGLTLAGAANAIRSKLFSASGGVTFGGAATVETGAGVQSLSVTGSGGFIFAGAATIVRSVTAAVSGGISFSGAAAVEYFDILSSGFDNFIMRIRRLGRR